MDVEPKHRVPQAEAKAIMVQAVIDILTEQGLPGVTYRDLAARTGFNQSYVARYFGHLTDLLIEVADELGRRSRRDWQAADIPALLRDPDIRLRLVLIQHLLAAGVDPQRFADFSAEQVAAVEASVSQTLGVSSRVARVLRAKVGVLLLLMNTDLPRAFGVDESTIDDIVTLLATDLRASAAQMRQLGW